MFLQQLSESHFEFFSPYTVYKGVQHGCEDGVKCRDHLIMVHSMIGFGLHIDEYEGAVEQPHHCQVRRADGKVFQVAVDCIVSTAVRMKLYELKMRDNGIKSIRMQQTCMKTSKTVVSVQARLSSEEASQKKWLTFPRMAVRET
jgi:hypothetical protein